MVYRYSAEVRPGNCADRVQGACAVSATCVAPMLFIGNSLSVKANIRIDVYRYVGLHLYLTKEHIDI